MYLKIKDKSIFLALRLLVNLRRLAEVRGRTSVRAVYMKAQDAPYKKGDVVRVIHRRPYYKYIKNILARKLKNAKLLFFHIKVYGIRAMLIARMP